MKLHNDKLIKILLTVLGVYIAMGSVFYHVVEGWNWVDSLYFTVITLSTVGYGDFSPHTTAGKLFTIPFIFIGVGLFIAVANAFLRNRGTKMAKKRRAKKGSLSR